MLERCDALLVWVFPGGAVQQDPAGVTSSARPMGMRRQD